MDAHNALSIDPTKFGAAAISEDTQAFNKKLMEMMSTGPRWYEVSRPAALFSLFQSPTYILSGRRPKIPRDACCWRNASP